MLIKIDSLLQLINECIHTITRIEHLYKNYEDNFVSNASFQQMFFRNSQHLSSLNSESCKASKWMQWYSRLNNQYVYPIFWHFEGHLRGSKVTHHFSADILGRLIPESYIVIWEIICYTTITNRHEYWGPKNIHKIVEYKRACVVKVIGWMRMVDGKILPAVWCKVSVNSELYLEQVMKGQCGLQWSFCHQVSVQDGGRCHETAPCPSFWLPSVGIMTSQNKHHWPP